MKGKICIITGANAGIGKETAVELAKKGATVVAICRNPEKTVPALEEIKTRSGSSDVHVLYADLSSQKQVRRVAEEFKAKYPRLDVLVNNAGFIQPKKQLTEDGIEIQFATNHLAPFLLTNLLLDHLKNSAPARVVTVSSAGHLMGHMNFEDLDCSKRFNQWRAYCNSKLANILFARELAKRLEGTGVTSNALHPGAVATNFLNSQFALVRMVGNLFMINAEKGARTSVYLASSPEVESVTGEYFANCRKARAKAEAGDPAVMMRLWEESAKLTGLSA